MDRYVTEGQRREVLCCLGPAVLKHWTVCTRLRRAGCFGAPQCQEAAQGTVAALAYTSSIARARRPHMHAIQQPCTSLQMLTSAPQSTSAGARPQKELVRPSLSMNTTQMVKVSFYLHVIERRTHCKHMPHIIKGQDTWEITAKKHEHLLPISSVNSTCSEFLMVFLNRTPEKLHTQHNRAR